MSRHEPSWSTIAHVRILDADPQSGETVRTAVLRTFEVAEPLADATARGPASTVPDTWCFSVDTAGRRFPGGPTPLAPHGSGPATVALLGDIDAVDRVAALLSTEFATQPLADDGTSTLTLRVHPDTRP